MNRLALAFLFLGTWVEIEAQPWPLIRLRQLAGTNTQRLENPPSAPDAGIQVIGMNSITGRTEVWEIETHLSFAGMEEFDASAGTSTDDRAQTMILVYRHWWSHRPQEALQALRKARYLQVSTFQVGLGAEADFSKMLAARKAQLDSINLDRPDLAYQAILGAPTGTVIILSPLSSLKSLDDGVSRNSSGYLRSTGSPSPRAGGTPANPTDLLQENLLFRINPRLSAVAPDIADADPAFWKAK